ncbi:hypothetical protein MCOR27_006772 [Pyricularia oryzae]|uniref:Cullin family profile domain-containing protein n=2 Tax=Pyricularia TaxID=48558 RepID=A0ABQ8NS65_PYRGI|nr:Cullin-4B [Pyricularia oryzae 70-15]KAH8837146.1 hypothetical protein MCOR01_010785 [Pyricularia oryzae]KAI6300816.1 hypothetical protein MCOR33_003561 [Pyricularia grisea]EHA54131.1 Cullin-4B [Pyricularia oryzae 70-15]KAI6263675.1 hypothetical protein MCOR19_000008 [Pyricularia oryzae]KAI6275821.1 hypothetical protein MCOR27_006772 [Pyricularia oryzae]
MLPTYNIGDGAAAATSSPPSQGQPKRRHRVDSNPLAYWGGPPADHDPDPKRIRPEQPGSTTMSAKAFGKRPATDGNMAGFGGHTGFALPQAAPALKTYLGARKLVVKNLKQQQTPAVDDYYTRAYNDLESALQDIFQGRQPRQPLDRLYRHVESICRRDESAKLFKILQSRCDGYVREEVLPKVMAKDNGSEIDMVRIVHQYWKDWSRKAVVIRSLFSYLDRTFIVKQGKDHDLNDVTITSFRRVIYGPRHSDGPLAGRKDELPGLKVMRGMLQLVTLDRAGDRTFDGPLLKDAVKMLHVFNVYGKEFEEPLLADSVRYFEAFALEKSENYDLKDYVASVRALINREDMRCNVYNFDSTTKRELMSDIQRIAIQDHTDKLLDVTEVGRLIGEADIESLKGLYELLRMTGQHMDLRGPWEEYAIASGSKIISDTERGDEMVVLLLELQRKLLNIIRDAFGGNDDFRKNMRDAFCRFMNDKAAKNTSTDVGERVAKYIDMLLRGGLKALPPSLMGDYKDRTETERADVASAGDEDAELNRQLDNGLELFRFIQGKDVFEAFYKRDLARRLLMARSASQDAERTMLAKLKVECGSQFTHNLEQMFKDQEVGKEELAAYKEWRRSSDRANKLSKIDLNVNVLSASAWPSYPDDPAVALPAGVLENLQHFEQYYKNKHEGRKLTWKHSLSQCVIKATFPRGTKELVMSAHQAAVLAIFNSVEIDEPLSYEEIEKASGLSGDLLQRTLQSLACGKARVLAKAPKGREVGKEDTFTVNKGFTDPKIRIKINQIQLKETKAENKETHERVAADRQFETQAAIVRIMKSRKTLPHAQLVAEVIEQTRRRGALEPAEIKANIEKLIDKEYIEREGGNYVYMA